MKYKEELKDLLGDGASILFKYLNYGTVGKYELKRLASEFNLHAIFNAYKDKDPFDDSVARDLLSDMFDKAGDTILRGNIKIFSGMRGSFTTPRIQRSSFWKQ